MYPHLCSLVHTYLVPTYHILTAYLVKPFFQSPPLPTARHGGPSERSKAFIAVRTFESGWGVSPALEVIAFPPGR